MTLIWFKKYVTFIYESFNVWDDDVAWYVNVGATTYVCKHRYQFKTCEPDDDIFHMGNKSTEGVCGRGSVVLKFSSIKDNYFV